jgi:F0F1-type ATP synthase membrane subunit a
MIELISYIARLFSLAIRLFANMMAGHILLKLLSVFIIFLVLSLSG